MFEEIVDTETAQNDFDRMANAALVDIGGMNEKELAEFEETKRMFVRLIQTGQMAVKDDGNPKLKIGHPDLDWLDFKKVDQSVKNAQGRIKEDDTALKYRAMVAEATSTPGAIQSKAMHMKQSYYADRIIDFFLVP